MNPIEPLAHETFEAWIARQGVRNFRADEFTSYFTTRRRGVENSAPPREMWKLILPTLRIADDLRDFFGRPVTIVSSYRSPEYNAAINGAASRSFHMRFQALDIVVAGHAPPEVFARLKSWRDAGKFTGGLGLYHNFVHVDTRGRNATF